MVHFGVIGAGNIANKFCEAVNGIEGSLYAVASRDVAKANRYKEAYGFEKAYGSYDALFEDDTVDCVYIATPHALHHDQMMRALDHGKHILCEKSFTLNASMAEAVFNKAKEKGLFVMEAMWTRFLPSVNAVMKLIQEGTIGKVSRIEANFTFDVPIDGESRLFNKALGGGALLDIGIYPITLVNMVLGAPESFETTVDKHENGVDIAHTITYHYKDATAYMNASFQDPSYPRAMIYGKKGSIEMPFFWQAEKACLYDVNGRHEKTIDHPFKVNGFEYQIEAVIACIESGKLESAVVPHALTLDILRQMDALRQQWNIVFPQET